MQWRATTHAKHSARNFVKYHLKIFPTIPASETVAGFYSLSTGMLKAWDNSLKPQHIQGRPMSLSSLYLHFGGYAWMRIIGKPSGVVVRDRIDCRDLSVCHWRNHRRQRYKLWSKGMLFVVQIDELCRPLFSSKFSFIAFRIINGLASFRRQSSSIHS